MSTATIEAPGRTAWRNQSTHSSGMPWSTTLAVIAPPAAPTAVPAIQPDRSAEEQAEQAGPHGAGHGGRLQVARLAHRDLALGVADDEHCVAQLDIATDSQAGGR